MNPRRWTRTAGSAVSFLGFGLVGMLLSLFWVPVLYVLPGGRRVRERRALRAVHRGFQTLLWAFGVLRLVRIANADLDHYASSAPGVIIANHPTYIDIVVLLAKCPGAVCIVKNSVWNNPCMGPLVNAAGFLPNRDASSFLEKASQAIAEGKSVIIFPEGTRSHVDAIQPFQRGAVQLALRTKARILPILITWSPPTLQRGCPWHRMADRTCNVELKTMPSISIVEQMHQNESLQAAARRLTADIENCYAQWLKPYYEANNGSS
ncbi:MAG: lysophospholipid acyltransferase family protein [Verrucomicrobia bacterium]|nr:lysophospholipid acyltransferase family protein [Verrucomicrobiota bacterium]